MQVFPRVRLNENSRNYKADVKVIFLFSLVRVGNG